MPISRIYIDASIMPNDWADDICRRIDAPVAVIDHAEQVYSDVSRHEDPVLAGKQSLYLTRNQGAFIKPCPGTSEYRCCDYHILNIGAFCTMDCAYCILQAYFRPPVLQLYMNHADMMQDLDRHFRRRPDIRRIGTGEFTDSMIWELWTPLSSMLVPAFARQQQCILELKTKTVAIDGLARLDHHRKTIMAWSLNTERVIAAQERGTASLDARLTAARRCADWGYPLAFHFDPMIIEEGSADDYCRVVDRLFQQVPADQIVWISLGTFRFMPSLKPILEMRFPESAITCGEFIPGCDNKMRYFKPLRIKLYRQVVSRIRHHAPDATVYFCMEDDAVWQAAMGFTPESRGGLPAMLDESAVRHCNLVDTGNG